MVDLVRNGQPVQTWDMGDGYEVYRAADRYRASLHKGWLKGCKWHDTWEPCLLDIAQHRVDQQVLKERRLAKRQSRAEAMLPNSYGYW